MFSYAPPEPGGSGFAIATERFLGLVSPDAGPELAAALFRLLDAPGSTLDQGLSLIADAEVAERFALAEIVDPDTQSVAIAVRGDLVVDLGSATTTRFSWPEGATWLAGEAHGAQSLRLALSNADPSGTQLPIARGVALAFAASVTLAELPHSESGTAVLATPTPTPPEAAPQPTPSPAPEPAPAPAEHLPSLDRTPQRLDLAAQLADSGWTLQLPDGNELDAAPQIVVGRRPWRTDPDETSTYYIVAPSPRKEISGKHVEFAVVGDELQARDMGSTNGTLVIAPDKPPRLLHEGRAVRLDIGDTLDLGEGFRIVVGART
jgi:hypothetical protein